MSIVVIDSFEAFLIHTGKVIEGSARWDNVDILPKSIVIPIVTSGEGWDKRIDARGARFIQDIQTQADSVFAKYPEQLPEKAPRIKVESREGSNGLDFDLTQVIQSIITSCPSESIPMIIYTLIGCGFGLGSLYLVLKHFENKKEKDLIEKAMSMNQETVAQAFGAIKELTAPIRRYVSSIGEDDLVSIAGSEKAPASDVKQILRQPRARLEIFHANCDGAFTLMGLDLKQYPPALIIEQDNKQIRAFLERLDQDTRTELVSNVEQCIMERRLPRLIQLQIDVYFNSREIKHGAVIGVGEPRREFSKHYRLGDIPTRILIELENNIPDNPEEN
jgi:hypothetical protein